MRLTTLLETTLPCPEENIMRKDKGGYGALSQESVPC